MLPNGASFLPRAMTVGRDTSAGLAGAASAAGEILALRGQQKIFRRMITRIVAAANSAGITVTANRAISFISSNVLADVYTSLALVAAFAYSSGSVSVSTAPLYSSGSVTVSTVVVYSSFALSMTSLGSGMPSMEESELDRPHRDEPRALPHQLFGQVRAKRFTKVLACGYAYAHRALALASSQGLLYKYTYTMPRMSSYGVGNACSLLYLPDGEAVALAAVLPWAAWAVAALRGSKSKRRSPDDPNPKA